MGINILMIATGLYRMLLGHTNYLIRSDMSLGWNVRGVKRTWGETYVGWNVRGVKCTGVKCPGVKCHVTLNFYILNVIWSRYWLTTRFVQNVSRCLEPCLLCNFVFVRLFGRLFRLGPFLSLPQSGRCFICTQTSNSTPRFYIQN